MAVQSTNSQVQNDVLYPPSPNLTCPIATQTPENGSASEVFALDNNSRKAKLWRSYSRYLLNPFAGIPSTDFEFYLARFGQTSDHKLTDPQGQNVPSKPKKA